MKFKLTIKRHLTIIFGLFSLIITVLVALVFNFSVETNFEKYANNKNQQLLERQQDGSPTIINQNNSIMVQGRNRNYQLTNVELELRNSILTSIILIGLISFIISLIIGHFISFYLSKPLKSLTKTTEEIEKGNYNVKIDYNTSIEEIYQLSNSLIHMANQISESIEKDKRLSQDVQHEIRTPLTNLKAQLEAMLDGVLDLDLENIKHCLLEVERLTKIVQQLHQIDDIENDNLIKMENLSLYNLINSIFEEFKLFIKDNNIKVSNLVDKDFIIKTNEQLFYSVLYNLISNSIRYSGKNSIIKVYLEQFNPKDIKSKYYSKIKEKGNISLSYNIICVEDNGVGIQKESLDHIFERFYREDKSRSRKVGGAGLGLSIVLAALSKLKGFVEVESIKQVKTVFSVFIEK